MIYFLGHAQVSCGISQIESQLGLSKEEALQAVSKMPVLLALDPRLLVLGMNGKAIST